jgi:hypothetical protein
MPVLDQSPDNLASNIWKVRWSDSVGSSDHDRPLSDLTASIRFSSVVFILFSIPPSFRSWNHSLSSWNISTNARPRRHFNLVNKTKKTSSSFLVSFCPLSSSRLCRGSVYISVFAFSFYTRLLRVCVQFLYTSSPCCAEFLYTSSPCLCTVSVYTSSPCVYSFCVHPLCVCVVFLYTSPPCFCTVCVYILSVFV